MYFIQLADYIDVNELNIMTTQTVWIDCLINISLSHEVNLSYELKLLYETQILVFG